jgi:MFS family permease
MSESGSGRYLRVLGRRPVFLLWVSQLVSQSGDFIFDLALLWLVVTTTSSLFYVGLIGVAIFLPQVAVGPALGVYIDRLDRGRILLWTNLAEGGVTAVISVLFLTSHLYFPLLFALVFVLGSFAVLGRSTTGAVLPILVPDRDLVAANSLFALSAPANQLASLAVGGIVIALVGVSIPILYDSLTFFAAAAPSSGCCRLWRERHRFAGSATRPQAPHPRRLPDFRPS